MAGIERVRAALLVAPAALLLTIGSQIPDGTVGAAGGPAGADRLRVATPGEHGVLTGVETPWRTLAKTARGRASTPAVAAVVIHAPSPASAWPWRVHTPTPACATRRQASPAPRAPPLLRT